MIPVTKTFLPPIEEYTAWLQKAWDIGWITNHGKLLQTLQERLREYLDVSHITITTNGTLPLQLALKLLAAGGEVITTPFSYVATSAAIVWEGCTPVFVDIHPQYLTIDESKIEQAITPRTTAILATHIFGNPCDVDSIDAIARRHGLRVIYDAAHCFGVRYKDTSIFNWGDVSTCSFHATKVFHTGEGGAMITQNEALHAKLFYSHNFGHNGPLAYYGPGINAKASELQAALGLASLPHILPCLHARRAIVEQYDAGLCAVAAIQRLQLRTGTDWNYGYYPVILETEELLEQVLDALATEDIHPRRYFYPSLNTIAYLPSVAMPVSDSVATRILCLPLYVGLTKQDVARIIEITRLVCT